MKRSRFLRLLLAALVAVTSFAGTALSQAANNHPVIFVHGFAGFGRTEMLGYKYWGGLTDLEVQLRSRYADQMVKTAVVGPFSSNWDRAVELYYQIKGGCVDYGMLHANTHGHLRRPEDYYRNGRTCHPGLYPAWDATHPVHLVTHSMGGQTARMLVQLLAGNGAPSNPGLFPHGGTGASWVKSVTTISTPNDGTTLAYRVVDWVPVVQQLVTGAAGLGGGTPEQQVYDFKLDQWYVAPRRSTESFADYMNRVMSWPLWSSGIRDLSPFDLSPHGAMVENDWVKDHAGVYYFSVSTDSSHRGWISGGSYANLDTNALVFLFVGPGWMGNFEPDGRPFAPVSASSWWPNDGVVNTASHKAPTWAMNAAGAIYARPVVIKDLTHGGTPQAGAWNWKGLMGGFDHFDIIGWSLFFDSVGWYKAHVDQLRGL
jgi:triacylglycerol lipase